MAATTRRPPQRPAKPIRFLRAGPRGIALLAEAALTLAAARLAVATRSPARAMRALGRSLGEPDQASSATAAAIDERIATIGWAIRCAAANVPFRAMCFEQALAVRAMLDRRGIDATAHYGIAGQAPGGDGALRAHVWTEADGQQITGYPLRPAFREVARFASWQSKDLSNDAD